MSTTPLNSKILTKTFFKLIPMQIMIVAMGSINSIIDGVIASRLIGPVALTITGLTIPCIKIIEALNDVLTGGSQILCGRSLGANLLKKTRGIFSLDIICVFILSVILSLVLFIILPPVYILKLGVSSEIAEGFFAYIKGYMPGVLALMLSAQLSGFLQLEHQEKRAYYSMAAMFVSNTVLNITFIKVLNLGMFGLGLATSISNWIACIVPASYYFTKKAQVRFDIGSIDIKDLKDITVIGLPGALVRGYLALRSTVLNMIIIKYVGPEGLCVFSAIDTFGCIYYATTAGIGTATRLLVSVYYGEKDRTGLIEILRIAIRKGLLLVCLVSVVLSALCVPFTNIFFSPADGLVYSMTIMGFLLFPLSCPLSCVMAIAQNYYQCIERMKIIHVLSFVDGVAGVCVSAAILAPFLQMNGVWIAQILNGVYIAVILIVYSVMQNHRFPRNIAELAAVPEFDECYHLDFSIGTKEEVVNVSQRIIDFCSEHGVDSRHSMYAGLCMEELAGNVVSHGFSDGKKHSIDIRLMVDDEGILLRLKDDCRSFNPKEAGELFDSKDITHNIGLRIIGKLVKKMNYQTLFGLNVLTIQV